MYCRRKKISPGFISSILLGTVLFCSCVSLKPVHRFSENAERGIQQYEGLLITFQGSCMDQCRLEAMRKFSIEREPGCDCALYNKADASVREIKNALTGYFARLAAISADAPGFFDFENLKESLAEGQFGNLTINKKDVDAYASISGTVLRVGADIYRKNKINGYIGEANEPIQVLLEKMRFIVQHNLKEVLAFRREGLYAYFSEMKLNKSLSDYEKGQAVSDYFDALKQIGDKEKKLDQFALALDKIARGHQELYDKRNSLSATELQELLNQYALDLQSIIIQLQKL